MNNVYNTEVNTAQMGYWSILSDNIKYVKHDEKSTNGIDIKVVDYWEHKKMYRKMEKEEGQMNNVDFGENPKVLQELDVDFSYCWLNLEVKL